MNPGKELLHGELHRHQQDRKHAESAQLPLRVVRRDEKPDKRREFEEYISRTMAI